MTTRTLYGVILKIFGLIFLRNVIELIPALISSIILIFSNGDGDYQGIFASIGTTLILAFYAFVAYYSFFRTNNIIDKLQLDKGVQEDNVLTSLSTYTILTAAIFIIGGYILVDEIPNLCRTIYFYLEMRRSLIMGEAKSTKHKMSSISIFRVRMEFILIKLIIKPIRARKANNWSI